ncbi:MAG: response regulator [Bacteroidota bacterium]
MNNFLHSMDFSSAHGTGEVQVLTQMLQGKRPNVLVVDDLHINLVLLGKYIEKYGYEPVFAYDGVEAIEKLWTNNFDIVFMDFQMPVMDGFEALRIIRHELPEPLCNIPVIGVSASMERDAIRRFLELGANDFISKPYEAEDLRAKLLKYAHYLVA